MAVCVSTEMVGCAASQPCWAEQYFNFRSVTGDKIETHEHHTYSVIHLLPATNLVFSRGARNQLSNRHTEYGGNGTTTYFLSVAVLSPCKTPQMPLDTFQEGPKIIELRMICYKYCQVLRCLAEDK